MQLQQWQQCFLSDSVSGTLLLQKHINPAGKMHLQQAIEVYQNNCLGSRINALVEIYSTCFLVLGEGYFRQLARQYVRMHAADSADLNDYGEGFADFLQQGVDLDDFLYLADLARLDRLIHALHRRAGQQASDFALLSDADALLYCHSVELCSFDYPVDKVWLENQGASGASIVEDHFAPYCVVIRRDNYTINMQRIAPQEYVVLQALNNISLEKLAQQFPAQELSGLVEYLPRWIQSGWLSWQRP